MLTKLRLSAHQLKIERGRYSNTPVEDRLCRQCDLGEVETEEHFILTCPKYHQQRDDFLKSAGMTEKDMAPNDKLIAILDPGKTQAPKCAKFLYDIYFLRLSPHG